MLTVNIRLIVTQWVLVIEDVHKVYRAWPCNKLIEALDMACVLQLHVDNETELPLRQYSKGA